MEALIALIVIVFSVLSLYDPGIYRKALAPICFLREDDLPPFPRAAAVGLLLFFGIIVLVPGLRAEAGQLAWVSQKAVNVFVAIVFLIVGLGLAINPARCLQTLKWRQRKVENLIIPRIVGLLLVVGSILVARSAVLHH